jgi:hypothetical protein
MTVIEPVLGLLFSIADRSESEYRDNCNDSDRIKVNNILFIKGEIDCEQLRA